MWMENCFTYFLSSGKFCPLVNLKKIKLNSNPRLNPVLKIQLCIRRIIFVDVSEKDAEGNQGDQGNILEILLLSLTLIFSPSKQFYYTTLYYQ